MPAKHRGAISGLATTTKGVGLIVGPLLAGGAIDLASPYLRSTDGYQVLWPACALPQERAAYPDISSRSTMMLRQSSSSSTTRMTGTSLTGANVTLLFGPGYRG